MILVGSENVYCVEVERVLNDHPGVKLATVYGMPDDAMGERVKAVVVKQDESLTAAALRRHAAAKLADFKVPSSIEFMARADLPMTGSGKVAKAALKRDEARRGAQGRAREPQAGGPAPSGIADHVYGVTWELAAKMTGATAAILPPAPAGATLEQEKARVACALEESGEDVAGVVCLTALAGAALGDDVAGATKAALKTLLALLQALDECDDAPRVVVATRGAADDASSTASRRGADAALASCAVWGMVRSAAAEMPKLGFRVVDLCPCEPSRERDAAFLLRELGGAAASRRIRLAQARARRPLPVPRLLEGGPVVDADVAAGVHVVSGGTGARRRVGREARVAGGKAATLVLASRRAPSPELAAKLAKLASDTGATVVVEQADVSLASGAEALLARGAALKPTPATKLRVWHLAGVVDDGAAPALNWDRFADVLKPKVDGSLHLHAASLKTPVDTFVLFSSIYGLLGSRELTHYGAANAFQDGLAAARARAGLPALAVSWGTWADAGMAHRFGSGFEAHVKSTGMRFVPLDGGFQALAALSQLAAAAPADRAAMLASRVAAHVAEMMGVDAASLDRDEPVTAIGLSSMHTVEMVNFLNEELDEDFSPTMVFEHLAAAPAAARAGMLASRVAAHVADMMGVDAASLDRDEPVTAIGLSSMHTVEMVNFLNEELDEDFADDGLRAREHRRRLRARGLGARPRRRQRRGARAAPAAPPARPRRSLQLSSLALRLPGDANSPEALWANLIAEKDAVLDDVPGDRPTTGGRART
ncbi:acetolactate synthase [Aureococcus anophagefferens]|nr:acetolactate synthase [Aureococcus anophagefferens]